MGIFDNNEDDEVEISPSGEEEESNLRDEVETEIVGDSGSEESSESSTKSRRGREMRERSTRSRGNNSQKRGSSSVSTRGSSSDVSLDDIHRQNERIIELLEELNGETSNTENEGGDFDGVL